jgi:hypothetical protein
VRKRRPARTCCRRSIPSAAPHQRCDRLEGCQRGRGLPRECSGVSRGATRPACGSARHARSPKPAAQGVDDCHQPLAWAGVALAILLDNAAGDDAGGSRKRGGDARGPCRSTPDPRGWVMYHPGSLRAARLDRVQLRCDGEVAIARTRRGRPHRLRRVIHPCTVLWGDVR